MVNAVEVGFAIPWGWRFIAALLGIAVAIGTPVIAQINNDSAQKAFSQRNYPWYDAETDGLRPLEFSKRNQAKSADRDEIPLGKPSRNRGGGAAGSSVTSGMSVVAWILLAALITTVALLLAWTFFLIESRRRINGTSPDKRSLAESIEHLPFESETIAGDFRQLSQQAAAASDYRKAAIYLFSHVLVTLDQTDLIRLRKGKTNRQYLWELKNQSPLADFYQQTMEPFEAVFFGDHDLTQAEFDSCWSGLTQFEQSVNRAIGALS